MTRLSTSFLAGGFGVAVVAVVVALVPDNRAAHMAAAWGMFCGIALIAAVAIIALRGDE